MTLRIIKGLMEDGIQFKI